jgi:hypothetical protein
MPKPQPTTLRWVKLPSRARDLLVSALRSEEQEIALWPFNGDLDDLLHRNRIVIAETYPAEFYGHLGVTFSPSCAGVPSGKRVQAERVANATPLVGWASRTDVELEPNLLAELADGFGSKTSGEDRFDAMVGLLGMLNVVLGNRAAGEPSDRQTRSIEGWIFGQAASPRAAALSMNTATGSGALSTT